MSCSSTIKQMALPFSLLSKTPHSLLNRASLQPFSRSKNEFLTTANTAREIVRGINPITAPTKQDDMIDVNPPRGTRDFPPDEMRLRNWLFHNFREVSRLFAFEEIDFPVLESEALFVRKAGEEITQQLYNFEDKGGRRVALRPELTPSLARLILQKGKAVSFPLKWFTIGQCWRYERMTRGRRREHYQWNMDIIGVPGVEAESELLSAVVTFFKKVGITSNDVGIKISNRKVLQAVLSRHNVSDDSFAAVCVIVDKLGKLSQDEIKKDLSALGLSIEAVDGILNALSIKSLDELEDLIGSESGAISDLKQLLNLATAYGYHDWVHFDASVVRGLAYYTGTVFEGFDREGKLRAICGGGRYDGLLATYGGPETPACGFGFGDAVIMELLREKGTIPSLCLEVDYIIVALEDHLRQAASTIATRLRACGHVVDLVLENKRLKWVFRQAERVNAKHMILIGSTEWEKGTVRVKDLSSGNECDVSLDDLAATKVQN